MDGSVMHRAEPPHIQRPRIVVVMAFDLRGCSAPLTRPTDELAGAHRDRDRAARCLALWPSLGLARAVPHVVRRYAAQPPRILRAAELPCRPCMSAAALHRTVFVRLARAGLLERHEVGATAEALRRDPCPLAVTAPAPFAFGYDQAGCRMGTGLAWAVFGQDSGSAVLSRQFPLQFQD